VAGGAAAPTLSLSANPGAVTSGGSSMLTWASTNATACMATGAWSGAHAMSGTQSVAPAVTSTYSMACSGAGGSVSKSATITMGPVPVVTLSASPASVSAGGSSTLTWSATNVTACTASGAWSGARALSGTFGTGALGSAATYTLACTGANGSATRSVTVAVVAASGAPTAASAAALGPLSSTSYTSGIAVPAGAKFQQPTIWYPSGGSAPYPGVVYMPGYTSDYLNPKAPLNETDVIQWAHFLSSHGFVVMFINSSAIATAGPADKATALVQGVAALVAEGARAGSPIAGLLQSQNIAVMGHSFGGAGALFAANGGASAQIKAVVALSPVPDSSGAAYPNDQVPSLVFGGQGDPLYGSYPAEFATIPASTSRMLAVFLQNSEYSSMHNIARNPLGAHSTDPQVARFGLSFLELYLVGDARYQQFLVTDPQLQVFSYYP